MFHSKMHHIKTKYGTLYVMMKINRSRCWLPAWTILPAAPDAVALREAWIIELQRIFPNAAGGILHADFSGRGLLRSHEVSILISVNWHIIQTLPWFIVISEYYDINKVYSTEKQKN